MQSPWNTLTEISEARLFQARAQLHQAAQLLTAMGISYLEPKPDDSHTSLLWSPELSSFVSQPFGKAYKLVLNPATLKCQLYHNEALLLDVNLNGATLQQIAADLQFFFEDQGLPSNKFTMKRHFELPEYPDRWSVPFDTSDTEAFKTLQSSYKNAYPLLHKISRSDPRSSRLLTWPHHFDMAVLKSLDEGKSIGIGMSPGDESHPIPYYYVNLWPYPSIEQTRDFTLSNGTWHTLGWTGMVLTLNQITREGNSTQQALMVQSFLREGIAHAEAISKLS